MCACRSNSRLCAAHLERLATALPDDATYWTEEQISNHGAVFEVDPVQSTETVIDSSRSSSSISSLDIPASGNPVDIWFTSGADPWTKSLPAVNMPVDEGMPEPARNPYEAASAPASHGGSSLQDALKRASPDGASPKKIESGSESLCDSSSRRGSCDCFKHGRRQRCDFAPSNAGGFCRP